MTKTTKLLERIFEAALWKSRAIVLLAVMFSMLASFALFIAGSFQIWEAVVGAIPKAAAQPDSNYLLISIIGAVDLYLIAIVLMIFSFGVYELFISKLDPARADKEINILEITTLDGLKSKLLKVIIMVLIVHFFKSILSTHFEKPLEMLALGGSILMVAACTFFIRGIGKDD